MSSLIGSLVILSFGAFIIFGIRRRRTRYDDFEIVVAPPPCEEAEPVLKSDMIAAELTAHRESTVAMLPPSAKKPLDEKGYLKKVTKRKEKPSLKYKPFRRLRHDKE